MFRNVMVAIVVSKKKGVCDKIMFYSNVVLFFSLFYFDLIMILSLIYAEAFSP